MLIPLTVWAAPAVASPAPESPEAGVGLLEVVELMLAHDPNLSIQEARVESSRGVLLSASGRFDPLVSSSVTRSDTETPISETAAVDTEQLESFLGISRELRSGLSLEPSLELTQTQEPGQEAVNLGTVSFTFRQPLLRDRGRVAVAAGERSAQRSLAAAELDLRHTVSERVLAVVSQYWRVVAARFDLEALRASETSTRELLETTRKLVAADMTPAAELVQLEADLAAKESSRIGGERALFAARQALGREIGLEPESIPTLPPPADPFPDLAPERVPEASETPRLLAVALSRRADLEAARRRLESVEILVAAADNGIKPRLDLLLTPSYSGLVEGGGGGDFLASLYRNAPGLSSSVTLSLSWPTTNRQARGELIRIQASERESALAVDLLVRSLGAEVPTALDGVRRSAQQLERASRAVRLFEQAVVNEEKKLRAGTSTLIDVISQKDRLTAARLNQVSAHLALALALAELRFQTGTLLSGDLGTGSIDRDRLKTVPLAREEVP